jgi:hypothetical protein
MLRARCPTKIAALLPVFHSGNIAPFETSDYNSTVQQEEMVSDE